MNLNSNPTTQEFCHARLFEEPLAPIGADPTPAENAALAAALLGYSERTWPDDFSSLTDFLDDHAGSPWNVALLTNLGLEYFRTGHYSKALEAWVRAWEGGTAASDVRGKAVANRAVGELAYMYARLGRVIELGALLQAIEGRAFSGPATERITGAREGLWNMQNRPEISFRCGPLALQKVTRCLDPTNPGTELIRACASTQQGCSLFQIEQLAQEVSLSFRMVFREKDAAIVVPSVVHLKLDHFAAITRQEADHFLLQDPTFGKDVWVTRKALDAEASGYFLIPIKEVSDGWRALTAHEGQTVWGKGSTGSNDPDPHGPCDPATPGGDSCPKEDECKGLAAPRVHLMLVSLNIIDEPLGYAPPVGPAIRFIVRYNQREANQVYSNLGPKWTFDWLSYITDQIPPDPSHPHPDTDVRHYLMGGGTRTFTGFDGASFAFQQYDQTKLTRKSSPDSYEMLSGDGTKKVFSHIASSIGPRHIFLTQIIDPYGNEVSLGYVGDRLKTITDAIGQVTTILYEDQSDTNKITKVIDPFGRFATFAYDTSGRLIKITDVLKLESKFIYDVDGTGGSMSDFIVKLTTAYGDTSFIKTESGFMRSLETIYPDGDRDRVELRLDQCLAISESGSDPPSSIPRGMARPPWNNDLFFRNTFYWSKKAYASAYPDYTKAKTYHWLHHAERTLTSGILESVKEPLEARVWYDYAGQTDPAQVGDTNKPAHIGRVVDDGTTQLYAYEYNDLGNVTKTVDPVGRTFSYDYDNGNEIDLTGIRQTRPGQNELLSTNAYDAQHLLRIFTDAAGQRTIYTYNDRGQVGTKTDAKHDRMTYIYDLNGYLTSIEGPLPDSSIVFTYDSFGRLATKIDESGYKLTFDYDDLDRLTKITFPDGTFNQYTYMLLDVTMIRDRAGRETTFEYNGIRQMTKRTDPLNRVTLFQWCKCGALRGLTDPMGRTTFWRHDIQGRLKSKEYVDGSKVTYRYEDTTSRLSQRIDEKLQITHYDYSNDDTLRRIAYTSAAVPTPPVAFAYDANYCRVLSMTDTTGTTRYDYFPFPPAVPVTDPPMSPPLGAGQLASVDGPMQNDLIAFGYDELGRRVSKSINGAVSTVEYDTAGRVLNETNALGAFDYSYDRNSFRQKLITFPNQTTEFEYWDNIHDQQLKRITNQFGAAKISEFLYDYDFHTGQISIWSQQVGSSTPSIYTFTPPNAYDPVDQLTSASLSDGGSVAKTFGYSYDFAGNRKIEQIDTTMRQFSYNALNQLTSVDDDDSTSATYEWDAEQRLTSISSGDQRTEFTYDGLGRRVGIRKVVVDGAEVSNRRFVWCDNEICEERTPSGDVSKRFFAQGMEIKSGPDTGVYFFTRDHLGSIRELIDSAGLIRARYAYDPYGPATRLTGDMDRDFEFGGMLWVPEINMNLTLFRVYDPALGRWLSRDPLKDSELSQGQNLYTYVTNDPVNRADPEGLADGGVHVPFDPNTNIIACMRKVPILDFKALFCCMYPSACTSGPAPGPGGTPPFRGIPPERDPSLCRDVKPFSAKINCCFDKLGLPTGDVCLAPEQYQRLKDCMYQ